MQAFSYYFRYIVVGLLVHLAADSAQAQFFQQGGPFHGTAVAADKLGSSLAISADGNTAVAGAPGDVGGVGAAFVFVRSGGVWVQQAKLIGTTPLGNSAQGTSVAISADGNTVIVGGPGDNGSIGAAWVFTRSGGVWGAGGVKIIGASNVGASQQGSGVGLSSDGTRAVVGGSGDSASAGAVWFYVLSAGIWAPDGGIGGSGKQVGTGGSGASNQGFSVSMSADGQTAIVGGPFDNTVGGSPGAVWIFSRSGGAWAQSGTKLLGNDTIAAAFFGYSVSVSAAGNDFAAGGWGFAGGAGSVWIFNRVGGISQQHVSAAGNTGNPLLGFSVAMSADGTLLLAGGIANDGFNGAFWTFTRSANVWSQSGNPIRGTGNTGAAQQGVSVAISGDKNTVLEAGNLNDTNVGALWGFGNQTATHFTVSAPASATAGTPLSFTVTAQDVSNLTDTGYTGTVHFTSSDGQAVLPANATLTNGVGTFSATLKTAGSQTITATDTVTASMTGTSGAITVSAAAASHYSLSAPASATANSAFSFTVTALDPFNNTSTGYAGTVHFTSSDAQAVLPANATLTNGLGTFSATLKTVGSQTITGTDTVTASITGTSNAITATAGSSTHFSVSAPASATAGTPFSFTVTALDGSNLTATGYSGTVHFTSSDGQAVLPANATLTNGVGTFSATLKTAGSRTITATDTVTASITGTSGAIAVAAGPATHFTVSTAATPTPNTAFTLTVTAVDAFGNIATGYTGTVQFTSSDSAATLPGSYTFVAGDNGAHTFSATLQTVGPQTITVSDGSSSGTLSVTVGQASSSVSLTASPTTSLTAGQSVTLTATVLPADATGTVTFLDGGTPIGVSNLSSGVALLFISTLSPGSHTITAMYGGNAKYLSSTSAPLIVTVGQAAAAPIITVTVTSSQNPAIIGQPVTLTVTVTSTGSIKPTGIVQFFDNLDLIGTAPLINGQASLPVALGVGSHNLSVTYSGNLATTSTGYGQYIVKASGVLSLTSNVSPSMQGQAVTFTAQLSLSQAPAGLAGPTGMVQFFDGSVLIGTGAMVNGVASITVSNLAGGAHQIGATYLGDSNWNAAFAKPITQVVQGAQSATGLRFIPVSGGVMLSAKVSAAPPSMATPTGTVQFVDTSSGTVLSTVPLTGSEASVGLKPDQVKAGMKFMAVYSGDASLGGSSSTALTVASARNAASYSPGTLAADAIATVFGAGFGAAASGSGDAGAEPQAQETALRISDRAGIDYPALLFFVSPTQINFLIPSGVAAGPALVAITNPNGEVSLGAFTVARVSPGMFSANATGEGVASAWMLRVHPDGSQDQRLNVAAYDSAKGTFVAAPLNLDPVTDKVFLEVYVTGIRHGANVMFTIDGQSVPVLYAGAHSQFAGLDQINLQLPASLRGAGEVTLRMAADGENSNPVTVLVK